jgi:uncharacterized protein
MGKNIMKKSFGIAVGMAALMAASAAQAADIKFVNIATASTAGSFYPSGIAIAQLITDKLPIRASAQSSAGSVENVDLLRNKEANIAMINNNVAIYATKGTKMFKGKAFKGLRILAPLFVNVDHVVVRKAADIKSLADIRGKRWALGPPGSGTMLSNQSILGAYGITKDDVKAEYISQSDTVNALKNNMIDGGSVLSGLPFAAVNEALMTAGKRLKLYSMTADEQQKVYKSSGWKVPITIPAGTYPGQDMDVQTVSHLSLIMTTTDLPDELGYKIAKTMFENRDRLVKAHKGFKSLVAETAKKQLMALPLEIHPGTKRYLGIK